MIKKAQHQSPKTLLKDTQRTQGLRDTEDTQRAMDFPIDNSLEVSKNEEELVLKKEIYRGEKRSYLAKFDTNYL